MVLIAESDGKTKMTDGYLTEKNGLAGTTKQTEESEGKVSDALGGKKKKQDGQLRNTKGFGGRVTDGVGARIDVRFYFELTHFKSLDFSTP